jgi:hypothetical protein
VLGSVNKVFNAKKAIDSDKKALENKHNQGRQEPGRERRLNGGV